MPSEDDRGLRHFERILYLKKLPGIGGLTPAQLATVADYMTDRYFPRGSVMLRDGEPIRAIFFVVVGTVHLRRHGKNLGHGRPGAAVGGLGLLAQDDEGIEAVAETDVHALELDAEAVREVLEDDFGILHHLTRDISAQLVDMVSTARRELVAPEAVPLPPVPPGRELDLVERIFILRHAAPFAHSNIDALAEVARSLVEVRYPPGTTLFEKGDPSGAMFLLVSGTVTCKPAPPAPPFRLAPGIPVGGVEALAELPRWYDAVTDGEVVALSGDVEALIDAFEDHFAMAMGYLATMAQWLLRVIEGGRKQERALQEFYGCEQEPVATGTAVEAVGERGGA